MKHLIYVSQARAPMTEEELSSLLSHSRACNARDGISGLLVYRLLPEQGRGNFLQILEGPEAALENVWYRISTDRRHHSVIVLEEGPSERRMFPGWTMGFRNVEEAALSGFEGFEDLGSDAFWARAQRDSLPAAMALLTSFYEAV